MSAIRGVTTVALGVRQRRRHVYSKLRQSAHGVPPWIQECMLSRFHVLESVSLQTFPCNLLAHDTKMDEIDAVL